MKKPIKIILPIALIGLIVVASYFYFTDFEPSEPPTETGVVAEAIDDLTFRLESGHRIRYVGLEAPREGECFSGKLLEGNVNLIGKEVRLEVEPMLERSVDGAWTRYVWVREESEIATSEPPRNDGNEESEIATSEPPRNDGNKESEIATSEPPRNDGNKEGEWQHSPTSSPSVIAKNEAIPEPKEILINNRIIEMGLAFPLLSQEMKHYSIMTSSARYASATKKGLWGQCEIYNDEETGRLRTREIAK